MFHSLSGFFPNLVDDIPPSRVCGSWRRLGRNLQIALFGIIIPTGFGGRVLPFVRGEGTVRFQGLPEFSRFLFALYAYRGRRFCFKGYAGRSFQQIA